MNKKILIVEDDQLLTDTLVRKLSLFGYTTQHVHDGAEAINTIRTFVPNLILLDIILPNKNGYEILEEISIDPSLKNIPIIVISNSGQPVEISKILALGVKDYIVKAQFNLDDIVQKVQNQIAQVSHSNEYLDPVLKGKKILWIEDDGFLTDIIHRKFSTLDCTLIQIGNGEEALKYLKDNQPDIVVLDLLLPGMSGYDILKSIKSSEVTKSVPVVMLSNMGQKEDAEKAIELGAEGFIVKAVMTVDEVLRYLAKVLNEKSAIEVTAKVA